MIKGKVFLVPVPAQNGWKMVVVNEGNSTIGVTQNILPKGEGHRTQHDDHTAFGHGLVVAPGKSSWQMFTNGVTYRPDGSGPGYQVEPGMHLRLGLRGLANKVIDLPPLDGTGQPIVLNLSDFEFYSGNAQSVMDSGVISHMEYWQKRLADTVTLNTNTHAADEALAEIEAILAQSSSNELANKVRGQFTVTAHPNSTNGVSHWTVRVANQGETPFMGTVVFKNGSKNAGIGLEAMACPKAQDEALQRIEANGDYGPNVVAQPGEFIRLGIRGFGSLELALPEAGQTVQVATQSMERGSSTSADDYFDLAKVTEKREEKRAGGKVQFFSGGQPLNGPVKPVEFVGEKAIAEANFNPPKVKISFSSKDGGWYIEVENPLPPNDGDGPLGFICTLNLRNSEGKSGALVPRRLDAERQGARWLLPFNALAENGVRAVPNETLVIGTRGMGYYSLVSLPDHENPIQVETEQWRYQPHQYNRNQLKPEFINQCPD